MYLLHLLVDFATIHTVLRFASHPMVKGEYRVGRVPQHDDGIVLAFCVLHWDVLPLIMKYFSANLGYKSLPDFYAWKPHQTCVMDLLIY
jgi:hypothetical protein